MKNERILAKLPKIYLEKHNETFKLFIACLIIFELAKDLS